MRQLTSTARPGYANRMSRAWFLIGVLAGCSVEHVRFTTGETDGDGDGSAMKPEEDCAAVGDEDGNGKADCADDVCAVLERCVPMCGNGIQTPDEACDDGNAINGDTCDVNCTVPGCGNRIVDPNEECDQGAATSTCTAGCKKIIPAQAFDIAFTDEMELPTNIGFIGSIGLVVNTGSQPLPITGITVESFADDSATGNVIPSLGSPGALIIPLASSAGLLQDASKTAIVDSGLVSEPVVPSSLQFGLNFSGTKPVGSVMHATMTIKLLEQRVVVPFTITFAAVGTPFSVTHAARLRAQAM